jgi:hypothetical protein
MLRRIVGLIHRCAEPKLSEVLARFVLAIAIGCVLALDVHLLQIGKRRQGPQPVEVGAIICLLDQLLDASTTGPDENLRCRGFVAIDSTRERTSQDVHKLLLSKACLQYLCVSYRQRNKIKLENDTYQS